MATGRGLKALAAACSAILCAFPARAVTQNATVSANIVKPLTLTSLQGLDLGTVTVKPGPWSTATVGITRGGVFSCATANLVCSGAAQVASYNVTGTNNQVVRIAAPNVTLVNQNDASKTLTLSVDSPGSVVMPSSGSKGVNFSLGGTITLTPTSASGTYQGTFNVTVDYQ